MTKLTKALANQAGTMTNDAAVTTIRLYLPRRPRLRTALAVTLVGTILGLLLVACAPEPTANVVPPDAQPGDLALEGCSYEIQGAEFAADCGTLVVPENRADPGTRLIGVPVMRVHAAADRPAEPIFFMNGGPGQSNMTFEPPLGLLADHDFVLVGYRGVDGSVRLECQEYGRALVRANGALLGDSARASRGAAAGRCAERLQAAGVDLAGYTMPEVIADI